jgi:hypothetical protein
MTITALTGKIGKGDIKYWDGVTNTFDRLTSVGGVLTQNKFHNMVDVLQVYGNGTNYSQTAISDAISNIGTVSNVTLEICPGTWILSDNLTIPDNFNLYIHRGAVFDFTNGAVLTINGPFDCGLWQCFDLSGLTPGQLIFGRHITGIPVEWFGAYPAFIYTDPIHDIRSTEAIQAALDCAHYSTGTDYPTNSFNTIPVLFTGHYGVDSEIYIRGFQHLKGTSRPTFYGPPVIYSVDSGGVDGMFYVIGHRIDGASVSLSVDSIGFSGGNATGVFVFPATWDGVTQIQNSIYFDHCRFGGLGSASIYLTFASGNDIQISNCTMDVCNGATAFSFTDCSSLRIVSNNFFEPFGRLFDFYGIIEATITGNNISYTNNYFMLIDAGASGSTITQNITFSGNTVQAGTSGPGGTPDTPGIIVGTYARTQLNIIGNTFDTLYSLLYFANNAYNQVDVNIIGNTFRNTTLLIDAQALLYQISGVKVNIGYNQSNLTSIVRATIDDHALVYDGYISPDFNDGELTEYTGLDLIDYIKMELQETWTTDFTCSLFHIGQFGGNQHLSAEITIDLVVSTTGPPSGITGGSIKKAFYIDSYSGTPPTITETDGYSNLPASISNVTLYFTSISGNAYNLFGLFTVVGAYFPATVTVGAVLTIPKHNETYPLTIKSAQAT